MLSCWREGPRGEELNITSNTRSETCRSGNIYSSSDSEQFVVVVSCFILKLSLSASPPLPQVGFSYRLVCV